MTIQPLKTGTTLNDLPAELLTHVFSFLDMKTLGTLTTVSKKMKILSITTANIGCMEIKNFTNNVVNRLPKESFSIEIEEWKYVKNLKEIKTGIAPLKRKLVSGLQKLNLATINSLEEEITPPFVIHNIFRLVLLETKLSQALAIQNQHEKNIALQDISLHLIKENEIERAIEVAKIIPDEEKKSCTLHKIVRALIGRKEIEKAIEVAKTIPDEEEKSCALRHIVSPLIRGNDIGRAIEVAKTIPDEEEKSWALRNIVTGLTQRKDIEKAIEVAKFIPNKRQKVLAFLYIVGPLTRREDIERVIEVAGSIHNEPETSFAFQVAESIFKEPQKSWALDCSVRILLNKVLLQQKDIEKALVVATFILEEDIRGPLLEHIFDAERAISMRPLVLVHLRRFFSQLYQLRT